MSEIENSVEAVNRRIDTAEERTDVPGAINVLYLNLGGGYTGLYIH